MPLVERLTTAVRECGAKLLCIVFNALLLQHKRIRFSCFSLTFKSGRLLQYLNDCQHEVPKRRIYPHRLATTHGIRIGRKFKVKCPVHERLSGDVRGSIFTAHTIARREV